MKSKILTFIISALLMASAYADHHEAPGAKYILNIQNFTTNMAALIATQKAFADSGALNERQVGMVVYQINAGGRDGANVAINFFYQNAASLPPPNVMIQSDAHAKTFMQSNDDDSWVGKGSSIYETIHQVGQLTPETRVFQGASIKAMSADYPEKLKNSLLRQQSMVCPTVYSRLSSVVMKARLIESGGVINPKRRCSKPARRITTASGLPKPSSHNKTGKSSVHGWRPASWLQHPNSAILVSSLGQHPDVALLEDNHRQVSV
jgi:hypothetical protein